MAFWRPFSALLLLVLVHESQSQACDNMVSTGDTLKLTTAYDVEAQADSLRYVITASADFSACSAPTVAVSLGCRRTPVHHHPFITPSATDAATDDSRPSGAPKRRSKAWYSTVVTGKRNNGMIGTLVSIHYEWSCMATNDACNSATAEPIAGQWSPFNAACARQSELETNNSSVAACGLTEYGCKWIGRPTTMWPPLQQLISSAPCAALKAC